MAIQLKTHDGQTFGFLIEPSSEGIKNDEQLYKAVDRNNGAIVGVYREGSYDVLPEPERLTYFKFRSRWKGD